MKKLPLVIAVFAITACGPPSTKYRDYRDSQPEVKTEQNKFSPDPLLDSIYRAQYLEMLRRCGSGDDQCRKTD